MTDPDVADAVYLEPITVEAIEQVIARERPEGLLAGLGGQTGLNMAVALARAGVLEKYNVRLIGTPLEAIEMAEDRELFRDLLDRIGQPYAPSYIVEGETDEARDHETQIALDTIGLPAIPTRSATRRPARPWPKSACPRSSGRRSRSAAPAAASSKPRPLTGNARGPACALARSTRS